MKLKLTHIKPETSDVISFFFQPSEPLTWQPGQYLHYRLPHPDADDRGEERYFTVSSAPHEGEVRITTRFAQGRSSTFKQALRGLKPGDQIELDGGVRGEFTLDEPTAEYVFIAGGIGITPFRSILADLTHRNQEIVYRDELDAVARANPGLKIRYLIDPERIDESVIKEEVADLAEPVFYVSGPKPMVNSMQELLEGLGVPTEHIKRDAFPGYD
jgi:glycine betaine catabolism B